MIEVRDDLGDLVVGPLDRFAAWFAKAVRVLLVGDVNPPARLADTVEFAKDQFGPVEYLQRMAAGDEIELVVLQQQFRRVAIDIFDALHPEIGGDVARIGEAGL